MNPKLLQATLDLQISKDITFSDLVVGAANNLAVYKLRELSSQAQGKVIILFGPSGSGKTLLSKLWQNTKTDSPKPASKKHGKNEPTLTIDYQNNNHYYDLGNEVNPQTTLDLFSKANKIFDAISSNKTKSAKLVIDNFDLFVSNQYVMNKANKSKIKEIETRLFNCLEETSNSTAGLLITTKAQPYLWKINMLDLKSRLDAIINLPLELPDDETLKKLLLARLELYGMQIKLDEFEKKTFPYLIARMERSYQVCLGLAKSLYDLSLLNGGNLTIPVAKQALQIN